MSYEQTPYQLTAEPLGHIEGLTVSSNHRPILHYFGGIPYALPPSGEYRFRPPRKLPPGYRYGTAANPARFTGGAGICPQPPSRIPPDPALFDDNCLQLNMWIPAQQETESLPVMVYLHGGFLQWGSPNWTPRSMAPLLGESAMKAIIVMPAYRLNAFGFLTGKELAQEAKRNGESVGNMGFWDQRMAIEWVHRNIAYFGGNPDNITVGGYSAGAFSAFQQLAHELYMVPDAERVIKRTFMLSNGPGVAPKSLEEHQRQFDEFITKLDIPLDLADIEKLARLRALPYHKLIEVQPSMKISEFRALAEGHFIPADLFSHINSGNFAKRMKVRNITLLMGECRDEHTVYRTWRTPSNSYEGLYTRLCAEYPSAVVAKVMQHYCGTSSQSLPPGYQDWQHTFGHIYADMQVHHLERGFLNTLSQAGMEPGRDVLRYRFERRLQCVDATLPVEWGVTHSSDVPIWFRGSDFPGGLMEQEKGWLKGWNDGFAAFVRGEEVEWGTREVKDVRRWRSDGETDVWEDQGWDAGVAFWEMVQNVS